MANHWENILDDSEWEVSMVKEPPQRFDVSKGFELTFELTNLSSNTLDGTTYIHDPDLGGGLSLNTYAFGPGETRLINFTFPGDPVAPDISNGNSYTFEIGLSGPADLFRVEMDAVEGASGPTDANPDLINIAGASTTPSEVMEGESVKWEIRVNNDNDVGAEFSAYWMAFPSGSSDHVWSWSAGYSIPANSEDTFELTYNVDNIFLENIGGEGTYDFKAGIDMVDDQGTDIGPVDAGDLTIGSPGKSDINVSSISGPGESQVPGDKFTVTATVSNDGTVAGERTFDVYIDASRSAGLTAKLDAGQTKEYGVEITAPDKDQVTIRIGDKSVSVDIAQGSDLQPELSVTGLWAPSTTPSPGDDVTVTVKVENTGGADGTTNFDIIVNGKKVGVLNETVPSSSAKYFDVNITTPDANDVTVEIGPESQTFSTTKADDGSGGGGTDPGDDSGTDIIQTIKDNKYKVGAIGAIGLYALSQRDNQSYIYRR